MSSQQPSGPSQPSKSEAYTAASNPVIKNDRERAKAGQQNTTDDSQRRKPEVRGPWSDNSDAEGLPTALGQGAVHGSNLENQAHPGDTSHGTKRQVQNENVNAEQMAPSGEGKVADAVERKSGMQRYGNEDVQFDDYSSNLDRKKMEQADAREAIKEARQVGDDVDGGRVQRKSGPVLD